MGLFSSSLRKCCFYYVLSGMPKYVVYMRPQLPCQPHCDDLHVAGPQCRDVDHIQCSGRCCVNDCRFACRSPVDEVHEQGARGFLVSGKSSCSLRSLTKIRTGQGTSTLAFRGNGAFRSKDSKKDGVHIQVFTVFTVHDFECLSDSQF